MSKMICYRHRDYFTSSE
uniref:Uncharacterized protein n=1 Tax=Arundo donax TaxID=35708 RepID=A0A0A8ZTK6_ARUDO